MRNILDEIIEYKRYFVKRSKKKVPLRELEQIALEKPDTLDFIEALTEKKCALIAEIKTASPSKGIIRNDVDVKDIAKIYEINGASCISVLTDEKFFMGSLERLLEIRKVSGLPLLRKDFIIDAYQLYEARVYGADAVLLIASCLENSEMTDLIEVAVLLGLDCLIEVHDEIEMKRISGLNVELIGINNRDLKTFKTDISTTGKLASLAPEGALIVSESGINTAGDVNLVFNMGAGAVLVGEAIMREKNMAAKVMELSKAVK
jgi:indole-3-glycerol phosphate synthase